MQKPNHENKSPDELVERLVRPEIRALAAYHVNDASGLLKLDAMENPYHWPDDIRQAWLQRLGDAEINRYPQPDAPALKAALREVMGIRPEYAILLGNGSDEIIQIMAMALARPGSALLSPEPGFVMFSMISRFVGLDYHGVPLQDDFDLDLAAMLDAIARYQPALIFLAVPNNPTGNLYSEPKIRQLIEASEGLVVIDEAYTAFADAQLLSLLDDYPNVVVMRTLSKVGLAGLRLGMLIGSPLWLQEFEKIRLPYNIGVLTQLSAEFALQHYPMLMDQAAELRAQRAQLFSALEARKDVTVWPSQANFLLLRCETQPARSVFESLKREKVLVKCLDGAHPLLTNCLRVTVSTEAENRQFLEALDRVLAWR